MNQMKQSVLTFFLIFTAFFSEAQTDSLELACPLPNGSPRIIRASDKDYQKSSEYGVMFTSKTDTSVVAVHDAQVVIVARTEDAKYDIVLQNKGYYFWYAGIVSPRVKTGAKIKSGAMIGTYKPGDLLELMVYLREEPVNLRKYVKCK
jgi:murein DD-endopeptidase MepM/ murein hydrolase activator NlpD